MPEKIKEKLKYNQLAIKKDMIGYFSVDFF